MNGIGAWWYQGVGPASGPADLIIQDALHGHTADSLYLGPALVYAEGFEHQTLSGNQFSASSTGLFDGISAGASIIASGGRLGGSMLQISPAAAVCRVFKLIPGTDPGVSASSFYIRFPTALPTDDTIVAGIGCTSGVQARLWFNNATDKFHASWGNGKTGTDVGPVLEPGRWYLVDFRANPGVNPKLLDCQIDGGTNVQVQFVEAVSTCDAWVFGNDTGLETYTAQYDDFIASNTGSNYPIGPHRVLQQLPTGDGTHNAGTNVIEANDGTDIGVATAFDLLDEEPPSTADYVQQVATGAGNYAEVTFEDAVAPVIWGISAYAALFSSGTTLNSGTTRIVDANGNTVVDVFSGDMSETVLHYKTTLIPAPATTGWTTETLNALKARVGFSGNVASVPRWAAIGLHYVAAGAGELEIQSALHGHTADSLALVVDLTIQDALHAHAADNLDLTQLHILTIQDALHGHAADNLTLEEVSGSTSLVIQDALHAHAADNLALTQVHELVVQDALHGHAADNLGLTQVHNIVIQEALHGHAAENVVLTQGHVLTIQDTLHGHLADSLVLTQIHVLQVSDALHGHRADNVVLDAGGGGGPAPEQHYYSMRRRRGLTSIGSRRG